MSDTKTPEEQDWPHDTPEANTDQMPEWLADYVERYCDEAVIAWCDHTTSVMTVRGIRSRSTHLLVYSNYRASVVYGAAA